MADLADFIPIRVEDIDSIIARIDADLNAGVDPEDDAYIDTTPGTFYADVRTAIALELERLWDVATADTVAASLVDYAWGDYLDAHGATLTVPRREAVASTGEVTFTGTNGTIIGTGTEVSTVQTTADEDAVSFETTEAGTISGGTLTLPVRAVEPGAAGNVATGAVELVLSPITGISGITNADAITGGADIESDDSYRERIKLAWSAAQGSGSVADYERWALSDPSVGFVRVTPLWNGAGTVLVVVTDVENNPVSDAVVATLQERLDPYDADTLTSGTHTSPTTLTVDDTTGFADAGIFYVGDDLGEYTGKTTTTFTGVTGITGSIADNTPVIQSGSGNGLAPVGAIVTVKTASTVSVDIAADIILEDGYAIESDTGKIGVGAEIESILTNYIDSLPPGAVGTPGSTTGAGSILLNRIASLILRVPGVYDLDLSALQIDGANTDFAVGKFEVPQTGTITLAEV